MAEKANFTPDEWKSLLQSPLLVGIAVSQGLIGMLKESMASARALVQAKADPNADELVKAVAGDFETSEGRGLAQDGLKALLGGSKPADIAAKTVEALRAVSALLDAKADVNAGGGMALKRASMFGHTEIVRMLKEAAAPPAAATSAIPANTELADTARLRLSTPDTVIARFTLLTKDKTPFSREEDICLYPYNKELKSYSVKRLPDGNVTAVCGKITETGQMSLIIEPWLLNAAQDFVIWAVGRGGGILTTTDSAWILLSVKKSYNGKPTETDFGTFIVSQ